LFDTSGATATTVSGLGGIGAQNTSFSHCVPLFLEAGCSLKYLPTAQQDAVKLAKKSAALASHYKEANHRKAFRPEK
jgi:hypothetical protein